MCYTNISDIEDNMDDISSTSSSINRRKTKLTEPRKIRKPLMEKKRRARINQSLDELKRIVVDAEKLNGQEISRVNKLEKADILEMTVRYLKRTASKPSGTDIYIAGFKQCIDQVQELISEQRINVRQQSGIRMVEHLQRRMEQLTTPNKYPTNNYINLSPKQTNFDINHIRMAEKSRQTDLDNTPGSMWRPW